MEIPIAAAIILTLAWPTAGLAGSPFDGTWKADPGSLWSSKADTFMLINDLYTCGNCGELHPSVAADGRDHPVANSPYFDTLSATVIDARTVRTVIKRGGKTVGFATITASADGKTLTDSITDGTATTGAPAVVTFTEIRIGKPVPGAHAISGTWRAAASELSENWLTMTLKLRGNEMSFSTPSGQSYTARLGGPDAPYVGDPGITSVSVRRIGRSVIEETDKRGGKIISIASMTLSADGTKLTTKLEGKLSGTDYVWSDLRQAP